MFIGIFAIAGAALVIDRGLLAPSSAAALPEPAPATNADTPTLPQGEQSLSQAKSAAQVLMDRLSAREPEQQASLGSAFSLEQLIEPVLEAVGDQDASQPGSLSQAIAEPTLPVIQPSAVDLPTLSSVMPSSNGGGGAVLGGKLIRVGQTDENGFVLKQVRKRGVVLERDGRVYSLEMPMQTGP